VREDKLKERTQRAYAREEQRIKINLFKENPQKFLKANFLLDAFSKKGGTKKLNPIKYDDFTEE